MSELLYPAINLAILITLLVVYLRAPIRGFVRSRHENLRDELKRVRELLVQSQSKHDEFTSKLKAMESEILSLREQARQDAQQAKSSLLAEAQRLSASIVSDSRASASGLYEQLRRELSSEIGGQVLDRAEGILKERLTGDDRTRIRNEFSTQVEASR